MKLCARCKEPEGKVEFKKHYRGNLQPYCVECNKQCSAEYYSKNRKEHISYVVEKRREKNREKKSIFDPSYKEHSCEKCCKKEPEVKFELIKKNDKLYKRRECTVCRFEYRKNRPFYYDRSKSEKENACARGRAFRQNLSNLPKVILQDSKRTDKRSFRENDLDVVFIAEKIKTGCSYYGETELRMTLDRVDNNKGHTKDNVNAACIRCNYFRRDMPYEAWLIIVKVLSHIRENNLFGNWLSSSVKKSKPFDKKHLEGFDNFVCLTNAPIA